MSYTRRQFLNFTVSATAACGLAQRATAKERESTGTVIDTHVYIGNWPHKRLSNDQPEDLVAALRRNNVSQAWVGGFDGLFHKDVASVNQRLADACSRYGDGILKPFGTVNPMLPDWEEDVRRCQESFHMPGIRLHPNYHGYSLGSEQFARLLELAASRTLIVQLVAWMADEPRFLLSPQAVQVDLKPLAEKTSRHPGLRLVVANGYRSSRDPEFGALTSARQVYCDFARPSTASEVLKLIDTIGIDRVVFGSGEPLHEFQTAWSKANNVNLSEGDRHAIGGKNAARLVHMPVSIR